MQTSDLIPFGTQIKWIFRIVLFICLPFIIARAFEIIIYPFKFLLLNSEIGIVSAVFSFAVVFRILFMISYYRYLRIKSLKNVFLAFVIPFITVSIFESLIIILKFNKHFKKIEDFNNFFKDVRCVMEFEIWNNFDKSVIFIASFFLGVYFILTLIFWNITKVKE